MNEIDFSNERINILTANNGKGKTIFLKKIFKDNIIMNDKQILNNNYKKNFLVCFIPTSRIVNINTYQTDIIDIMKSNGENTAEKIINLLKEGAEYIKKIENQSNSKEINDFFDSLIIKSITYNLRMNYTTLKTDVIECITSSESLFDEIDKEIRKNNDKIADKDDLGYITKILNLIQCSNDGTRNIITILCLIKTWIEFSDIIFPENGKIIVLIDEFENHLYPETQRKLMDRIMNYEKVKSILVSTHSPVLLTKINDINMYRLNEDYKIQDYYAEYGGVVLKSYYRHLYDEEPKFSEKNHCVDVILACFDQMIYNEEILFSKETFKTNIVNVLKKVSSSTYKEMKELIDIIQNEGRFKHETTKQG